MKMLPFVLGFWMMGAAAQQPAPSAAASADRPADPIVDVGSQWIGRVLFLRCFCADDKLSFDAQGHLEGSAKTTDWTLAGMNVQKVERKAPGEIELDGVRVAIRYAPDRNEFDRKPQNDDHLRVLIADTGDPVAFEQALHAVFAQGIDRPLQLSMPTYWQHYFQPSMSWPPDAVTGQPIESFPATPPAGVTPAQVAHKAQAGYTAAASHDRVTGTVKLRVVVDAEGMPRHIAIVQPLGYGLDAEAATAAAKFRFTPATMNGKPVASQVLLTQQFVVVQPPQ